MALVSRPYAGHQDLRRMIALEQRIGATCARGLARWQAGDIVWVLYAREPGDDVRVWFEGDDLAAFAFVAPELYVEALPGNGRAESEAFDWAEEQALGAAREGGPAALSMFVLDSDAERRNLLRRRGWREGGAGGSRMLRGLDEPIEAPLLPAGMRVRDCVDIDVQERAEAHRDAWSHLAEIGLPDVKSSFITELYLRLRSTPGYDASLDLAVQAVDGTIASCCIAWADELNGVGHFEPVGTRFAYRRRGCARAMILEGLRRFRDRGLHTALIGTAAFNHPARAAYISCGFEVVDSDHEYLLELT